MCHTNEPVNVYTQTTCLQFKLNLVSIFPTIHYNIISIVIWKKSKMINNTTIKRFIETFSWGVRHTQTFLLFFCMLIGYALRVNLSMGIVAMTDKSSANENFIVSNKRFKCILGKEVT